MEKLIFHRKTLRYILLWLLRYQGCYKVDNALGDYFCSNLSENWVIIVR
jgi:hypothetical protein